MKSMIVRFALIAFALIVSADAQAEGKIKAEQIEKLKPAVISIKIKETTAAYTAPFSGEGTGFVVDKENGIIMTNRHIASIDAPADFEATFYDGTTADLSFIYNDPTTDFAFLKVDPHLIPKELPQLKFSRTATVGEDVFMIGNNEARSHSVQLGKVSDLYAIEDVQYPQQTYHISLNSRGGSSGSPVFNERGEVIAINYAGTDATAFVIPISYALDALESLGKKETPKRYSLGATYDHLNVDHASEYYQYPNTHTKQKLAKMPSSRNRIIIVSSILPGTPAAQYLEVGDIIEKVGDIEIGPDLYLMEKMVNQSSGNPVKLTIFRNGNPLEVEVPTFNLNEKKCAKMLIFGKTVFASVDTFMSYRTGMPIGSVCVANNPSGSLFEKLPVVTTEPQVMIKKINNKAITTLGNLLSLLPEIEKKQKFNFVFKNYGIRCIQEGLVYNTHQHDVSEFVKYKPELYDAPVVISFDAEKGIWVREPFLSQKTPEVLIQPTAK